ncbi:MAG: hypothetical protein KGO96_00920 [Elusimicrobia bacterium]|nr:hypothetical protein [Elusimicrobiota bacterium]MDE2424457.1 hypothetical protein [Elusimicrobiota bacterium]
MENVRVFRNINTVDKLFGLEVADGCVLLLAFFVVFMVNKNGLFSNGLVLFLVYLGLRSLKRGKPDGYLLALTRYVLMSRFKRVAKLDDAEAVQ